MTVGRARHFIPSDWRVERQSSLFARSAGASTLATANIQLEAPLAGHQIIGKRLPLAHMRIGVGPSPTAPRTQVVKPIGLALASSPHHTSRQFYEFDQYLGYLRSVCNPVVGYFQSA